MVLLDVVPLKHSNVQLSACCSTFIFFHPIIAKFEIAIGRY